MDRIEYDGRIYPFEVYSITFSNEMTSNLRDRIANKTTLDEFIESVRSWMAFYDIDYIEPIINWWILRNNRDMEEFVAHSIYYHECIGHLLNNLLLFIMNNDIDNIPYDASLWLLWFRGRRGGVVVE